ncbi:hypothetical protein [Nostoc sp.]
MSSTPVEIVQALLKDPTKPEVVNQLVSPDAVYISLMEMRVNCFHSN